MHQRVYIVTSCGARHGLMMTQCMSTMASNRPLQPANGVVCSLRATLRLRIVCLCPNEHVTQR